MLSGFFAFMATPSPQITARINAVAKELANGKDRAYILGKYAKKWGISRTSLDRYIEKAKPKAKEISERAEKTISDTIDEELKVAARNGLKSKLERVMILQGEIDKILEELRIGLSPDYVWQNGKFKKMMKEISVTDRAILRKTIKELQSEISKIEGDYASVKTDLTIQKLGKALEEEIYED